MIKLTGKIEKKNLRGHFGAVVGRTFPTLQTKTLKANGTHTADTGYDGFKSVIVDVPEPELKLQDRTVVANGTYSADTGYDALGSIKVQVPIPDGYLKPEGKLEITENGTHDVSNYAEAKVSIAEVKLQNKMATITKNGLTTILPSEGYDGLKEVDIVVNVEGGGGECSGEHVITVDELPTENIDEGVYIIDPKFSGVYLSYSGTAANVEDTTPGASFKYYACKTKPTENIDVMDLATGVIPVYYIADENDMFVYGDVYGNGSNDWIGLTMLFYLTSRIYVTFKGVAHDTGAMTEEGYYAYMSPEHHTANYYKNGEWKEYVIPSGEAQITEEGVHNIAGKETVKVTLTVPSTYIVETTAELPTEVVNGSMAIVLDGE